VLLPSTITPSSYHTATPVPELHHSPHIDGKYMTDLILLVLGESVLVHVVDKASMDLIQKDEGFFWYS